MRLKRREKCPLHDSYFCCGREQYAVKKDRGISRGPVRRIEDPHHPRGYRELCSPAELRRRMMKKLVYQEGLCAWCHQPIEDFREATPDHIIPRGMGASTRDDSEENICACHGRCNRSKGSRRVPMNEAGLYVVSKREHA